VPYPLIFSAGWVAGAIYTGHLGLATMAAIGGIVLQLGLAKERRQQRRRAR
jgi:hypothetical protein